MYVCMYVCVYIYIYIYIYIYAKYVFKKYRIIEGPVPPASPTPSLRHLCYYDSRDGIFNSNVEYIFTNKYG